MCKQQRKAAVLAELRRRAFSKKPLTLSVQQGRQMRAEFIEKAGHKRRYAMNPAAFFGPRYSAAKAREFKAAQLDAARDCLSLAADMRTYGYIPGHTTPVYVEA